MRCFRCEKDSAIIGIGLCEDCVKTIDDEACTSEEVDQEIKDIARYLVNREQGLDQKVEDKVCPSCGSKLKLFRKKNKSHLNRKAWFCSACGTAHIFHTDRISF